MMPAQRMTTLPASSKNAGDSIHALTIELSRLIDSIRMDPAGNESAPFTALISPSGSITTLIARLMEEGSAEESCIFIIAPKE